MVLKWLAIFYLLSYSFRILILVFWLEVYHDIVPSCSLSVVILPIDITV